MCNIVKHLLMIVSLVCTLCILLSSCIDDWTAMLPHDYSCYWNHHCNAHLINPNLKLPDRTCDTAYYNLQIAPYFPANSIHAIMPSSLFSPDSKCDFRWTATVYTKTCSSNTEQTQTIALNSSDYTGRLFVGAYGDFIDGAPLIDSYSGLTYGDVKHQLTFQIHNVNNAYDSSIGTITWTKTWEGFCASELDSVTHRDWLFYFPPSGLIGTYTAERGGGVRYIYVHTQFGYY